MKDFINKNWRRKKEKGKDRLRKRKPDRNKRKKRRLNKRNLNSKILHRTRILMKVAMEMTLQSKLCRSNKLRKIRKRRRRTELLMNCD